MPSDQLQGPVLVTGGTGFLGRHLIVELLEEGCKHIVSVSRNPTPNPFENVDYRTGSITDKQFFRALVEEVKPKVIIHAAAPRLGEDGNKPHYNTTVKGTSVVLECAKQCPSTEALVFTSSVFVKAGGPQVLADESGPVLSMNSKSLPTFKTKAEAERLIRQANGPDLRTVALRLAVVIGEGDLRFVAGMLGVKNDRRLEKVNLMDTVAADNAAYAHLLAAKALLDPKHEASRGKIDGEEFHITDGNPMDYWDMLEIVARASGVISRGGSLLPGPARATRVIARLDSCLSALWFVPKFLKTSWHLKVMMLEEYTYSIEKARQRLGFNPIARTEEVLEHSVACELKKREGEKRVSR